MAEPQVAEPREGGRASFSLGELCRCFASHHRRGAGGSDGTVPLSDGGVGDGENGLTRPGLPCSWLCRPGSSASCPVLLPRAAFLPRALGGGRGVSHAAPPVRGAAHSPLPTALGLGPGWWGEREAWRWPCRFLHPWHWSRGQHCLRIPASPSSPA